MAYSKYLLTLIKHTGIALLVLLGSLSAMGQVLRGNVVNGTTKKPSAGDDVILLKIDKGMNEEKRTKSNARGEFSFDLPDNQFMRVVRVVHENVQYHQPVPPGSTTVAVTVYASDAVVPGVHRIDQSVIFQSQNGKLQVIELLNVRNDSQPPRTQPTFSFYLPEGARIDTAEAMREGGMPLKSEPVQQKEAGKYMFTYALIPGLTHFEVVYSLPYTGTLKYQPRFAGPVDKFYVVMPKSIGFSPESASQYQQTPDVPIGSGFKDVDVRQAASTAQESQLAFSISGEGMLQEEPSAQQAAGGGGGQGTAPGPEENERPGGGMGIPNERPNPLSQGQWAFLGVLTIFLGGGAVFVFFSTPNQVAAAAPQASSAPLLEALKEEMFQLETDRLQGKMNPQEYQGAKSVLDKTLKRAMGKKR